MTASTVLHVERDDLRADGTAMSRPQCDGADDERENRDAGRDRGELDGVAEAHGSHR